jgi:hypothetical protein
LAALIKDWNLFFSGFLYRSPFGEFCIQNKITECGAERCYGFFAMRGRSASTGNNNSNMLK